MEIDRQWVMMVMMTAIVASKTIAAPDHFDWVSKGVVTSPKNQGQLGSSELYAAAGAIHSYVAINSGRMVAPSVYEMHDCCKKLENPFSCVLHLGGLCSDADYPSVTGSCMSHSCPGDITIKGFRNVTMGSERDLMMAVLVNPVVVNIDASSESFQLYRGGVYSDSACSSKRLDHALLLVGYGTMQGSDYWLCQNSWGSSWGQKGYILIARNNDNMCGIATAASYPI